MIKTKDYTIHEIKKGLFSIDNTRTNSMYLRGEKSPPHFACLFIRILRGAMATYIQYATIAAS